MNFKTLLKLASFSFVLLLFVNLKAFSQADSTINLDMLTAPNSPAFTILGIEPTSIEEPTNPTDIFMSIRNSSDNFQAFPTSYSLDFTPGWVFGGSGITYEDFKSPSLWNSIVQNSSVSVATNTFENENSVSITQLGLGLKLSLCRGRIDEEYNNLKETKDSILNAMKTVLNDYESHVKIAIENSANCQNEQKEMQALIDSLQNSSGLSDNEKAGLIEQIRLKQKYITELENIIRNEVLETLEEKNKEELKLLNDIAGRIKFQRTGFKLDFSAGLGWDFPEQQFEDGNVSKYGFWLTGGNVWKSKTSNLMFTLLATTRLLFSPDESYEFESMTVINDNLRFDIGARLILSSTDKFSISAEGLYRSLLNNEEIDNTHKLALNLDYRVGRNNNVTMSIGRNFDGNFGSDGNLIALLNFITGFGSSRPF